ncbi:Lcl C-terminal domain-containing protein [Pseudomonas helleri]|uniref:DUF1566 domain-containing protein n=1 Tax=Pseudomonas helleri TaxID=1608996 RepID=A0A6I1WM52_9PSED|nr:DUF1566 domain-containing protein [Pseudomonas helleri]MQU43098.1 DUF1566 domain-containing protein [Pseudomonas helleri]
MQSNAAEQITIPAIGAIWPGQGGIYAGIRQYADGLRHVVFSAEDVGEHEWGAYGVEVEASSRIDGRINSQVLTANDGHPAASAAANYTADGLTDFYLPSIGELNYGWQFIPEHFKRDWHWSSTQRSANYAFYVYFDVGLQDLNAKSLELRVRPVRSWLI